MTRIVYLSRPAGAIAGGIESTFMGCADQLAQAVQVATDQGS